MKKLEKLKSSQVFGLDKFYGGRMDRTAKYCDSYTGTSNEYPCGDVTTTGYDDEGNQTSKQTTKRDCLI
jgi:hypothetical protein